MKRSVAEAIVAGFLCDGLVAALADDVLMYINTKYGASRSHRIQSLVGNFCKRAADALWDGNRTAAVEALIKYGLRDRISKKQASELSALANGQKAYRISRTESALEARLYARAASGGLASRARRGTYR